MRARGLTRSSPTIEVLGLIPLPHNARIAYADGLPSQPEMPAKTMPRAPSRESRRQPRFGRPHLPKARIGKPVSGRDLVEALANSPLRDVPIERLSVKIRVRDIKL
jgi:hypothetical protein